MERKEITIQKELAQEKAEVLKRAMRRIPGWTYDGKVHQPVPSTSAPKKPQAPERSDSPQ